jgi:NAD(P)-dependent dehydrogenase (short-subunit alcohol dehydrogenase family)
MSESTTIPTLSLEGQVAVVTGGGTGIGRAIALEFAEAGADVVVAGRRLDLLEEVAGEVGVRGRRCLAVPTDVSVRSDVERLVEKTLDAFGFIDILVNNAATTSAFRGTFTDHPEEVWDKHYDINFKGYFHCCQLVGKHMVAREKGNIINIASVGGFTHHQTSPSPYSVSKAAMLVNAKGLSHELAPRGIRVNSIAPGYVETDLGPASDGHKSEDIAAKTILGRIADPRDIAHIALFLASDLSRHIVGETIVADGGGYR